MISFLPGTYGTSLLRNHAMQGVFEELKEIGIPTEVVKLIRDSLDCNLYFFDHPVKLGGMYAFLGITVAALVTVYVLLHVWKSKRAKRLS